jgi:ABC-type transport system involved in multi-copper enzyme maturation permease subunit
MPIFDQGYQHWQGPLSGHAWRWLAITRHGVRVQMKSRILRLLVLLAWLPALGLVAAVALWGLAERQSEGVVNLLRNMLPADMLLEPQAYRATVWTLLYSFFFKAQMFFLMLLAVVAGPGLISRDLRFNALPLYFARPLTRFDYFLGKLGVIGALVASVAVVPAVFAYVVGLIFFFELTVVKDTYPVLLASVAFGLVLTLSIGTLMLALSSLSRRSLYVGIAWAGLWIISGSVGGILTGIHRGSLHEAVYQAEMTGWLEKHPPPPGVRMFGRHPQLHWEPRTRKMAPVVAQPDQHAAADKWYESWNRQWQLASAKAQDAAGQGARDDWRPLFSYVANLERIADLLLRTDAAWVAVGKAVEQPRSKFGGLFGASPVPVNERRLADMFVPQYPWVWSAGVLAGLLGLSTWTLTRRIKSLDRLR